MSKSLAAVSNIAKPSWCLDVMMMYFIPASLASCTMASASNPEGLNDAARDMYSLYGMSAWAEFMIHSALP